jgi:hypothetical protein
VVDVTGNIIIIANVQQAKRELTELEKKQRAVAKAQKEAEKQSRALTQATNLMGNAMLAGAAAGAALLTNSVRLAARTQTLEVVVNQLGKTAGYSKDQMAAFTKGVVDQGITLRHARTAIAMMAQANVDLAKSSQLARLAQDAAVIANLNSSETFQRLIAVIQTGNIRMARHLGLVVDFQAAYVAFAKAQGISVKELDQQQKAQIRVNEVMRAGQSIQGAYAEAMETAGKKVLSLERHLEESQRILGELFLPAFADAVDVVTKFLEGIQDLDEGQRASLSTTLAMSTAFAALGGTVLKLRGPMLAFQGWIVKIGTSTAIATGGLTLLVGALAALAIGLAAHNAKVKENVDAIDGLVEAAVKEGKTLTQINNMIKREGELRGLQEQAIEDVTHSLYGQEIAALRVQEGYVLLTQEMLDNIDKQQRLADEAKSADDVMLRAAKTQGILEGAIKDTGIAADDAAVDLEGLYDNATPDVESLIQGWLEYIDWMNSNMPQIQQMVESAFAAWDAGLINTGQFKAELEDARKATALATIEMGGNVRDTLEKLGADLGITTYEARVMMEKELDELGFSLDALNNYVVNIYIRSHRDEFVTTHFSTTVEPGRGTGDIGTGGGETGVQEFAEGGVRDPNKPALVGERGPELMIGNRIFDTATTKRLLASGAFASIKKFAIEIGGGGTPDYGPIDYEDTGGAMSLGGYIPATRTTTYSGGGGGGGGGTTSSAVAVVETATQAAAEAVEEAVVPAVTAVAAAVPSSQDIAAGIQQAQLSQITAQIRQSAELLNELKVQTEILSEQGTAGDVGRAVRDSIQSIV